jgi:hypothetical protein
VNELKTEVKLAHSSSYLEKFLGCVSIFVFIMHCMYKIRTQQLIFIFNPCHVVILVEAYLLISPNDINQRIIYTVLMNTLFSPWIALFFPVTVGLTGFLEYEMFWVEHFLSAIINPLVLSLSHRYYTKSTISIRNHIFSHVLFSIYQRAILFPVSQISLANLNFTLCPSVGKCFFNIYIFIS